MALGHSQLARLPLSRASPWVLNPRSAFHAEFLKTAAATLVGFGIMGFIGFFVKLIHIPINNIIVG